MIEIKKVESKKDLKKFIDFKYELYKGNAYDVPYLFSEEMSTLDKNKNASFECCEAEYFMAYNNGKIVGRIAGIINHRANKKWNTKSVRFSWFDFIDDREVSSALLDAVCKWGKEKGMTDIIGPISFTDMDREGMLVEGFEEEGNMYTNYNYPYYPQHMEALGYEKDNDYMEYTVNIPDGVPEKFAKTAAIVEQRYNIHPKKYTKRELLQGGMAHRLFEIINATYKDLYGFSELSENQIKQYIDSFIKMTDPNLVVSIVDGNKNDEMVGFGASFPSLSKAAQKCRKGRMLPWGWWHMLRTVFFHKTDTVDLLLIAALPEYRVKGANAIIFNDLIQWFNRYGFKRAEAMPQMETNGNVQANWKYMDSRQHKRLRCYKKKI